MRCRFWRQGRQGKRNCISKLARLTKEQRKIDVLFFIHKNGQFQSCHATTYQGVIDAIGLSEKEWKWAKKAPETAQVKYALKRQQIENFTCLHEDAQSFQYQGKKHS